MSLKAFHLFFIGLVTFLCVAVGVWALKAYSGEEAKAWQLWFGLGALAVAVGMVIYGRSFLRKMKGVSYL